MFALALVVVTGVWHMRNRQQHPTTNTSVLHTTQPQRTGGPCGSGTPAHGALYVCARSAHACLSSRRACCTLSLLPTKHVHAFGARKDVANSNGLPRGAHRRSGPRRPHARFLTNQVRINPKMINDAKNACTAASECVRPTRPQYAACHQSTTQCRAPLAYEQQKVKLFNPEQ